jgi:hypothetical protein
MEPPVVVFGLVYFSIRLAEAAPTVPPEAAREDGLTLVTSSISLPGLGAVGVMVGVGAGAIVGDGAGPGAGLGEVGTLNTGAPRDGRDGGAAVFTSGSTVASLIVV